MLYVRPTVAGAIIRDPLNRQILPATGGHVRDTKYWRRRLLAGEVEIIPTPLPPPPEVADDVDYDGALEILNVRDVVPGQE